MLCPQRTDDHAVAVHVLAVSEVTSRTAAAVLAGVPSFLFASSCSVYDGSPDSEESLTEATRLDPRGHYSRAKLAAEKSLGEIASERMSVVALRMGTLYGLSPRMRFDLVVNRMVRGAILSSEVEVAGEGSSWRPILNVQDAARAYVLAATKDDHRKAFLVTNLVGQNIQVNDIAEKVVSATRGRGRTAARIVRVPPPARVRSYCADGRLAREALGFVPRYGLDGAVRTLFQNLAGWKGADLESPQHENIRWLTRNTLATTGEKR
jgi:nucleoside-diphosphate-sugar epimerase